MAAQYDPACHIAHSRLWRCWGTSAPSRRQLHNRGYWWQPANGSGRRNAPRQSCGEGYRSVRKSSSGRCGHILNRKWWGHPERYHSDYRRSGTRSGGPMDPRHHGRAELASCHGGRRHGKTSPFRGDRHGRAAHSALELARGRSDSETGKGSAGAPGRSCHGYPRNPVAGVQVTFTINQPGPGCWDAGNHGLQRCGRSWGMDDRSHTWNKYSLQQ
jgi:hypothetical protein